MSGLLELAFRIPDPQSSFGKFCIQMIHFLKFFLVCALVLTVSVSACGPTSIQKPSEVVDVKTGYVAGISEINKALAMVAMNTSLPSADYQIGPEDLLQINLFNIPEGESRVTQRTVSVRVSQQGMVSLALIGEIKVTGLTPSGLERELRNHYDKYFHNPQVGVLVSEFRQRVSVIGAVLRPGVFELTGPKTAIDILAMAGGVTDKAGTQVQVYRQGPNGRESHVVDLVVLASNASLINANNAGLLTMPVQGGDVINVPSAGMFFVDGAVLRPGSYALGRHYSLTQALTLAGGVNPDLYSSDITIFRRKASAGTEPMTVNLNTILAGSSSDPKIEEDDVILVPINGFKYAFFRVFGQLLGWGTSVASTATTTGS